MATPTYDPIASTTLTSSASSVTFSSLDTIAAGYRDLVIVITAPSTGNANAAIFMRFNNTTTQSAIVTMSGNGSSAASSLSAGTDNNLQFNTIASTGQTQISVNILDFAATDKHKSGLVRNNVIGGSYPGAEAIAFRYPSTSAITSLQILGQSANLPAGSTFSLYGIAA